MSRQLRVQYEGAVYHVTARGNTGQRIYTGDQDRKKFFDFLVCEIEQQRWLCHAYCLMGTHYHLLLETPEPNLSRGMGRLNGRYSQWFNNRHARHGHLLQGRYHAIVVEKESYLLELCRYVVLNPVRARMVEQVDQWPWSSYAATAGTGRVPDWLTTEWVLSHFGTSTYRAQIAYQKFVADGLTSNRVSPWQDLRGQLFLGSEDFLRQMKVRIAGMETGSVLRSTAVRKPDRPTTTQLVEAVAETFRLPPEGVFDRKLNKEAFQVLVYLLRRVRNLPLKEVADMGRMSCSRVSQIQKHFENPGDRPHLSLKTHALLKNYKL